MAQTLITNSDIAEHLLAHFINSCQMARLANRYYQDEFRSVNGFERGNTIRILRPTYFVPREGATLSVSDIQERETYLNLSYQSGQDIALTSVELTTSIDDLSQRVLRPIAIGLANLVDVNVVNQCKVSFYNMAGTVGTPVNSFATFNQAKAVLRKYGVTGDYKCVMNVDDGTAIENALQNAFNRELNYEISIEGRMGELAGVEVYQSQNMTAHTNGAWAGTPVVAGAAQTGNTLNVSGLTAATTILAGDVFYISSGTGVYGVNPVGRQAVGTGTANLQRFVVTANAVADGAGLASLSIYPAITTSGPYQTVTASPSNAAALTLVGSGSGLVGNNLMFSSEAVSLAIVPLIVPPGAVNASVMTDPDTGISMRVIDAYDVVNDKAIKRVDVLYGIQTFPEYGAKIVS